MSGKRSTGPWKAHKAHRDDEYFGIYLPDASPDYPSIYSYVVGDDAIQGEANANLIAAAPDLFEALKVYLNAGSKDARRAASVQAKAAIAKAEGKTNAEG